MPGTQLSLCDSTISVPAMEDKGLNSGSLQKLWKSLLPPGPHAKNQSPQCSHFESQWNEQAL